MKNEKCVFCAAKLCIKHYALSIHWYCKGTTFPWLFQAIVSCGAVLKVRDEKSGTIASQ